RRESLDPLFTTTSTRMPPERPGGLGDATYADLLAFIIQENGISAGATELPSDATALQATAAPLGPSAGGGGLALGVTLPPPPPRSSPLDAIRAVTSEMLLN